MDELSTLCARVGETKLRDMVAAFYRRVRVDDVIGTMYPPDDWENAEKRLADFIVYRRPTSRSAGTRGCAAGTCPLPSARRSETAG